MHVWLFILVKGSIRCNREDQKCGPQSRRANALPATREKLKIEGEWYVDVFGRRNVREKENKRLRGAFIFFPVHGSCSVEGAAVLWRV